MWLYQTSGDAEHPLVLYDDQPDRRSKCPAAFLKDFKGYLHTEMDMVGRNKKAVQEYIRDQLQKDIISDQIGLIDSQQGRSMPLH